MTPALADHNCIVVAIIVVVYTGIFLLPFSAFNDIDNEKYKNCETTSSSVFCHVASLPAFTAAHQALKLQVDLSQQIFMQCRLEASSRSSAQAVGRPK